VPTFTVYGRLPVVEALTDPGIPVTEVLLDRQARGETAEQVLAAAQARGVKVRRVTADKVTRVSGNGRHDQGVVAEIEAPLAGHLAEWLPGPAAGVVLVLDGVTNPANVGLLLRTAVATGVVAAVLPTVGSPGLGPLVLKASAGTALRLPVLAAPTAGEAVAALDAAGWRTVGLAAGHGSTPGGPVGRVALVIGSETHGLSPAVADQVGEWLSLPMAAGVESLNAAVAGSVAMYDLAREPGGALSQGGPEG
jgi:23S rRNA (guanosine2251-2'-O)-methyltransferase